MQSDLSVGELERKVEEIRQPLETLVASLDERLKPIALRSYESDDCPQI
jgi:hypothetical protein